MKPAPGFLKLWELGRRLRTKGWKPLAIHAHSPATRRRFQAAGRTWELALNPSVSNRASMLNLWFNPIPRLPQSEWKRLERHPFCKALYRKMQGLRFLKVFGPDSGGSILFSKRITSVPQIAANLKRVASIDYPALEQQEIPSSPPVRRPIQAVSEGPRTRVLYQLFLDCRAGRNGFHSPHLSIGARRVEVALGHRWTVCTALYWNLYPNRVHIPSEFWAALLIWPPKLSPKEGRILKNSGIYRRMERSLKKHGLLGNWLEGVHSFGDFNRYKLRWKDVEPLIRVMDEWSIAAAIQE